MRQWPVGNLYALQTRGHRHRNYASSTTPYRGYTKCSKKCQPSQGVQRLYVLTPSSAAFELKRGGARCLQASMLDTVANFERVDLGTYRLLSNYSDA